MCISRVRNVRTAFAPVLNPAPIAIALILLPARNVPTATVIVLTLARKIALSVPTALIVLTKK